MNWYAFLIGLGSALAIWRVVQEQKQSQKMDWGFAALWVLFAAWLGARIAFYIWQPAIILDLGWQAFGLRAGGMVWSGAVFGAWIAILLISLRKGIGFLETADQLMVMLPPMVVTIWLAGWFSGSAYGHLMPEGWWIPITIDDTFQLNPRFPLQLVAAVSLFILFAVIEPRIQKQLVGRRTAIVWTIFSIHTLIFSFLRADLRPLWLGIAWDIWFVFVCIAWALTLCWMAWFRKPGKSNEK